MSRVILSNIIYKTTGEIVSPLDVDNYPQDWLDAIRAFAIDLPKKRREIAEAKAKL